MPKSVEFIVEDLNSRLRQKGGSTGTMLWPDFYRLYEIQRLKEPRPKQIQDLALSKYNLTVAFGMSVVVVSHDRNHDPI